MADNIKISLTSAEGVVLATEGKYCDKNVAITPNLATKSISENGTYPIPEGYAGYGEITVEVATPEGYIKPEGSITITENGTHDITNYASAVVNVDQTIIPEGYIKPEGSVTISENGTHDITNYASAVVDVPIPEGYIKPEGELEITANGSHNVTNYESVTVNVPSEEVEEYTGAVTIADIVTTISFTLDGIEHEVEAGTTWREFIASGAVSGYVIDDADEVATTDGINVEDEAQAAVRADDEIVDGGVYTAVASVYNITTNLTNLSSNAPATITEGTTATITLTAPENFACPESITVTGATYDYAASAGTITLSNPTDSVTITAAGVRTHYNITVNATNVTAATDNPTKIGVGSTATLTFTEVDGYAFPETVTVTGATSTFDAGTLTLSAPTADVVVTIAGVERADAPTVEQNDDGTINLYANEDTAAFNVYVDGELRDTIEVNEDATVTITFQNGVDTGGWHSTKIYDNISRDANGNVITPTEGQIGSIDTVDGTTTVTTTTGVVMIWIDATYFGGGTVTTSDTLTYLEGNGPWSPKYSAYTVTGDGTITFDGYGFDD